MGLQERLKDRLLEMFKVAGKETGYWGRYFLRSVRNNGGIETVKRMLGKRKTSSNQKGFQALIDAGRIDLSVEHLALHSEFRELFSKEELAEAERRLQSVPSFVFRKQILPESNFPEELVDEGGYIEGSKRTVTVNYYERDQSARKACVRRHGCRCQVCGMSFKDEYGIIGDGFIHIHHRKPLAGLRKEYVVSPTKDLVPVCPNCHAMLHTSSPPLGIEELKSQLDAHRKAQHAR